MLKYLVLLILLIKGCSPIGVGVAFSKLVTKNVDFKAWNIRNCENHCETVPVGDKYEFWKPSGSYGLQFKTHKDYCNKNCYIPYCKCNEKFEDWNYVVCRNYCEGKKNEKVDDKKNG